MTLEKSAVWSGINKFEIQPGFRSETEERGREVESWSCEGVRLGNFKVTSRLGVSSLSG
jgi:hypothetical protein